jgi:hypothetical protein
VNPDDVDLDPFYEDLIARKDVYNLSVQDLLCRWPKDA